jgi:hypothetical protein
LNGFGKAEEAERLAIAMAQSHCQGESHKENRLADGDIELASLCNALNRNQRSGEKGGKSRIPEGYFSVHHFFIDRE